MFWLVAVVLAGTPLPPAQRDLSSEHSADARALFLAGNKAFEAKHYKKASALFRSSLEASPRPSTAYNLANSYAADDRNAEAFRVLEDLKQGKYGVLEPTQKQEVEDFHQQTQSLLPYSFSHGPQHPVSESSGAPVAAVDPVTPTGEWRLNMQIGLPLGSTPWAQPQLSLGARWLSSSLIHLGLAGVVSGSRAGDAKGSAWGARAEVATPLLDSSDFLLVGLLGFQWLRRDFELDRDSSKSASFSEESFLFGGRLSHRSTGLGILAAGVLRTGRAEVLLDEDVRLGWPRWDVLVAVDWEFLR